MSTRSVICRQTDAGVQAIYCHFDGYLTGVGTMLALFYQSRESLDALFALGDLSSLGNSPEESIAYCRDMGDEGTEPVVYVTLQGVCNVALQRYGAQYIYYHNGRHWEVAPVSHDGAGVFTGKFSPLAGPAEDDTRSDPVVDCSRLDAECVQLRASVEHLTQQRDRLLSALGMIEVDKDGDGFICREAMEQVRAAIAAVDQPAAPPAPEPVTYSRSTDGEFFVGSFPTPEDAAVDALYENDAESVEVGENRKRPASYYVSGVSIVKDVQMRAYDMVGEEADDWLSGLFSDKQAMSDLERLVGDWIDQREPVRFWEVVNIRTITRAELVSSGHLEQDDWRSAV